MLQNVVRFILSMPPRWLVAFSGGKPIVIEGRTLDPRIQFLGAAAKLQPAIESLPPLQARRLAGASMRLVEGDPAREVDVSNIEIPAEGRSIKARVYKPRLPNRVLPTLVYYHMGGCVIGDLETCHVFCTHIAERAECVVVSVDYRLAPEHKFPAAVDDGIDSFRWVRDNVRTLGGNPARIAVGGDSAGGYISAVISQETKRTGEKGPVLQMMIYPAVVWRMETASMELFGASYPLNKAMMYYFRDFYFVDHEKETLDLRGSPGLSNDLSALPPALIYTAGHDPLVDQGRDYAAGLKAAGVPVIYRCYEGLGHCFTAMSGAVPAAKAALFEIIDDLRTALG